MSQSFNNSADRGSNYNSIEQNFATHRKSRTISRNKVLTYGNLINSYTSEPSIEYYDINDYILIESIGSGAFGQVWRAQSKIDGKIVVIKIINADPYKEGYNQIVLSDIIYPLLFDHPHIIKYKGIIGPDFTTNIDLPLDKNSSEAASSQLQPNARNSNDKTLKFIDSNVKDNAYVDEFKVGKFNFETFIGGIMDVAEQDLRSLTKSHNLYEYPIDIVNMMYQLIDTLVYLDNFNVIHGDIKPDNILTNPCSRFGHRLFMADFGLATNRSCYQEKLSNMVYTIWYRPPEIALAQLTDNTKTALYDGKADIWALGCTFYEIIMKRPLFPVRNTKMLPEEHLLIMIFNAFGAPTNSKQELNSASSETNNQVSYIGQLYDKWIEERGEVFVNKYLTNNNDPLDLVSRPYRNLLRRMLKVDPTERASAVELRNDPVFLSLPIGSYKSDGCYRYDYNPNLNCIERDRFFRRNLSFDSRVHRLVYNDVSFSTITDRDDNKWRDMEEGSIYYSELIEDMVLKVASDPYYIRLIDDPSYRQPYDILFCAIQLLFRYLDREEYIDKMNLKLWALTALSLAHNFISSNINRLSDYEEYIFGKNDIKRAQRRMMRLLNFDIIARTPFDSIQSYSQQIDSNTLRLAGDILSHISITDYYIYNPPKNRSFSSVSTSHSNRHDINQYIYRPSLATNCLALVYIGLYSRPPSAIEVVDYKSIEEIIEVIDRTITDEKYRINNVGIYLSLEDWRTIVNKYRRFIADKDLSIRGIILSSGSSHVDQSGMQCNYYQDISKHFPGVSFVDYRTPQFSNNENHHLIDQNTIDKLKANNYQVVIVTNCEDNCLDLIDIGIRLLPSGRSLYTDALPREAIKEAILNGHYESESITYLIQTRNRLKERIDSLLNRQVNLDRADLKVYHKIDYNNIIRESTVKGEILNNTNKEIFNTSRELVERAMIKFQEEDPTVIEIVVNYADRYAHKFGYRTSYAQLVNDRRYLVIKAK